MPRQETKAELKERADRASLESSLYEIAAVDLALGRKPDATEILILEDENTRESRTYRLFRAKGAAGGYLVVTVTGDATPYAEIHYFEAYKRTMDDHAMCLGGAVRHSICDVLRRLWNARAEILGRAFTAHPTPLSEPPRRGDCCPFHRSGGPLHSDSCGGDTYREGA